MELYIGLVAVSVFILAILFYYGILTPVRFVRRRTNFTPSKFLYYSQQCHYQKCGPQWCQLYGDMEKHFKLSTAAGIYYDDPTQIVDPNQGRITYGIIVNRGEESKIDKFLAEYPNYTLTTLRTIDSVVSSFPYRSPISFLLAVKKIYPNMKKFIVQEKIDVKVFMEIYHLSFDKRIDILALHGDGVQDYLLTTDPQPATKNNNKSD